MTRVAVDVLGGDHAPDAVRIGVQEALDADSHLHVVLVGPPAEAGPLARHPRVQFAAAGSVIDADADPARAVRATRDATVRVAMTAVRDGRADAVVSAGPAAATVAAARFALGLVPGVTRTPIAITVPTPRGPVALLDVAADLDSGPDTLVQFAIAGAAFAALSLGIDDPRVGLLSTATRCDAGVGDALRRDAFELLAATSLHFVGTVEPSALTIGGVADVVVTDGFTGQLLVKAFDATRALRQPAGLLLGTNGVVVAGDHHGGSATVTAAIDIAASAVRAQLPGRIAAAMADLIRHRRQLAGLA